MDHTASTSVLFTLSATPFCSGDLGTVSSCRTPSFFKHFSKSAETHSPPLSGAEFSAFCLLTFQLEKTWEDFILVFQDIYPDVAGIVINKWSVLLHSGTWHSSYYTHHYAPIPGVHLVTCLRQLGTYFCGVFLPRMTRRKRFPLTYLNHSYQPIFPWPTFAGSVLQGGHITDAKYLPLFLCSC